MKTTSVIVFLSSIAGVFACPGQDTPNPFLRSAAPGSPGTTGAPFVSFMEHLLVDTALLNRWLEEHPLDGDATVLREVARTWTSDDKATLDQIAVVRGMAGHPATCAAILEQIYPTGFDPGRPGTWPIPSSFSTRNTGTNLETGANASPNGATPWCAGETNEMISSGMPWNALVERTRHPEDVFIPRFRSHRIDVNVLEENSTLPSAGQDPFAGPATRLADSNMVFVPGITKLAARIDSLAAGGRTRLVFFRGTIEAESAGKLPAKADEISRLSFLTVRAPTSVLSAWMAGEKRGDTWTEVSGWIGGGKANRFAELSAHVRPGTITKLENTEEYIYPTEWKSAFRGAAPVPPAVAPFPASGPQVSPEPPEQDKTDGLAGASIPSAFDTRKTGLSVEVQLTDDAGGLLLSCSWMHVKASQQSVFRRIEMDGEWVPDVTGPLFASRGIHSTVRPGKNQWVLLGAVADALDDGTADREQTLLVFVKAE